jgi:hypothetical protein
MSIRARGQHRFADGAKPNDLTIMRKNGEWFASVTLARRRHHAMDARDSVDRREVFARIRGAGTILRFRRLIARWWESNGDAVVSHHNLLDEQSRDALTVLNIEGLGMAAQTLQECR